MIEGSDPIRDQIRRGQERLSRQTIEALVLEGSRSGVSEEWTPADVEMLRDVVRRKAVARRG